MCIRDRLQEDSDADGVGDSCDFRAAAWDTVSTGGTSLTVGTSGNFGDRGYGGVNLDYARFGDCDGWNAAVYIYDGSPVVCRIDGSDTSAYWSMYGKTSFLLVDDRNPPVPTVTTSVYQVYESGTFVTDDNALALEKTWWAPVQPDSTDFIIQQLRVYSYDGSSHNGLAVGELIDWDIPTDEPQSANSGGYSAAHNLIYVQGIESDGMGCQANDNRFGGQALLGVYTNDSCLIDTTGPHAAYTASNPVYVYPNQGFVASELYELMTDPGYAVTGDLVDIHSAVTFVADYDLGSDDTLSVFSVITSVENGNIDSLYENVSKARRWYRHHLIRPCSGPGCCLPPIRGNVDYKIGPAGEVDLADLTYLVAYLFEGGEEPPCIEEADANGLMGPAGPVDMADLAYLVSYLFSGGAEPVLCP